MKHPFNLTLLLLAALLLPAIAHAYDFEVDGIYYNIINDNEAEVTYQYNGVYGEAGYEPTYSGNVTIPATVTYNGITYPIISIGQGAFYNCSGLISIDIPNSITTISTCSFDGCSSLRSVIIPNNVTQILWNAFYHCTCLTDITIPESVTFIGDYAFGYCSSLTSITIPESVTFIGNHAFGNCTNLKTLHFNAISCEFTGQVDDGQIFKNCPLETVTIGDQVTIIPTGFVCWTPVTDITIPESVTTISKYAFYYCYELKNITIPNSVTSIGEAAFYGCSDITSVTIPNSVTTIDNCAFFGCDKLKDVYSFIEDPTCISMGGEVFYIIGQHNNSERTLHVPLGSLDDYQSDARWGEYFDLIVEMGVHVSSIELDKKAATVIEGETLQLAAIIMPEDATNKAVTWVSSNPNVATVDENGLVTAVGLGTATITAMTTDGSNLSASCQVTVTSESATCGFVIRNAEVLHGESIVIPVAMVNDQTILAFQTDVYLPEGFSLATNPIMEPVVTPSERLTDDHVMMTQNVSNGAVRVMCYTPNAMPIEGNEGDLFYITVQVPEDAAGDYAIYLRNSRLTTADYTELRVPDAGALLTVKTYIPGDANDSRSVNVADIVATAMYVMEMNPSPFIFDAADMNGDGEITVTDIMLIARMILYPEGMNAPRHTPAIGSNNDRMSGEAITTGATRKVSIMLDNEMDYSAFQLDLTLPEGLTASNFELTDRAGDHVLDVNTLANGKTRVLCYTPAIQTINGHEGAVLTFDITANGTANGDITVDGIELVTTACEMVRLGAFTIGVDNITAVNEVAAGKTVARVDYYNVAGQRLAQPEHGVTLQVTTYTDGTRTTTKLIQ